jgi:hypothetical protein
MKKLKLFFACLLMAVLSIGQVWADPAAAGTTLFSEDFSGYAKDAVPSGSVTTATGRVVYGNANVSYECTNGNGTKPGTTKIYTEALATGTSPEILIGKYGTSGTTGGTFSITGIPSGGAQEITVSYKQNKQKLKVAVSGSGYTSDGIDAKPDEAGTVTFDITVADGAAATFNLTFSVYSSNVRVDDILVTVKTAGEGGSSTPTCATPTFTPAAGAVLSGTTVTLSTTTEDADIYYTMGDAPTDPTSGSTKYSAPITITEATTIKAIAIKDGFDNSSVVSASYTVVTPLTTMQAIFDAATSTATPTYITFSDSWVVTGVSTNGKNVYITDGTKGMILYNTSGSMGLAVGNTLSGTVQRSLKLYNGAAELDAFTTDGLTIGTASLPAVQELDAEGIAALTGVNTGSLIKISGECTYESSKYYIAGVQLYNQLYSFSVSAGTNYECTGVYVQYNTTKEICPRSAADIVAQTSVANPTFSPAAGEYTEVQNVTLSCATDDATVYYTTDGTNPTNESTVYSSAIEVGASMTIKAIAYKGEDHSEVVSATYTINIPLPSHDFQVTHHFSTGEGFEFPTGWGGSYAEHEIAFTDDKVYFASASHQSGTITDRPVTKSSAIELILTNAHKLITAVRFDYAQWGTKTQSFVMKYSTDGGTTYNAFDPAVTGSDFAIQALTLPENVNAIQVTGTNSSNQVGLTSISFDLANKPVVTKTVTITTPSNGSLVVKNSGVAITSGDAIEVGTTLTIEATPNPNYILSAVSVIDEDEDPVSVSEYAFVVPSKNVTVSATFIENVKPDATLTLSEIGVTHDITGHKQDDVINLPLTATSCSKTFVGWDADADCDHAPTYAPGAEYTLASTTQTLYAVYADAAASSSWNVATSVTAGDVVVISTNTGYTANDMKTAGAIASSIFGATASTYGSENAQITELAEGTMEFTIGGNATDGWTLKNGTKYLKVTAAKKVGLVDDEETWTISFSGNNATLAPKTGDYTGYSIQYNYNTGNDRFTAYNTTQVAISLYKQVASYSNYSTDCQAAVATPTFSPAAGTYTEAQTVTISCATEEATIYYTTDGSTPTNESTEYTAAISVDENMTIKAIAVKAGMANSAVASASYTINMPLSIMDQIFAAATAAGNTATDVNITFGNWVVSGVSTNGKNVYVTDGTKGFIIFDNGGEMGFAVGDVLSGTVACKVQLYKGAAELTTLSSTTEGLNIAKEGVITPAVKAINALSGINTGAAVTINSVQFDGTNLSDGANEIKPYNSLFAYDALESGKYYNVTGIYLQFDATKEILPRSAADIDELTLIDPELSYNPASETIEVGDAWSAPTLGYVEGFDGLEAITYESSNVAVATVSNTGVIALGTETGTAVITASFAGNATYAAANATYTITVNPAGTSQNVVILAEHNSKFYAMTATITNETAVPVEVEYDGTTVTVAKDADKDAIQWTKKTIGDDITFQTKDEDKLYLRGTSGGATLSLSATACNWAWDGTNNCYVTGTRGFIYRISTNGFKNYGVSNLSNADYVAPQVIVIAPENIVITSKADPQLAYDPTSVTLTVGQTFVPATLTYAEGFDGLAAVTYESSNTDLATVEGGVVSLVADATGTATITATFAGNENYQSGSASYTITVNEAGDDLSGTWVLASSVVAGDEIIIMGANNADIYTMGKQNTNNRAAVASTLAEDVLNPGAATKVFTLVDAGEGKFAIQASNGNYLTSATSGTSNNLLEAADYELDNAKWTISIDGEGVASVVAAAGSKTVMQYNSGSTIFSCYGSASQKPVKIFKRDAAPTPVYETVRSGLTAGNYYTICYPKAMTDVQGATLWSFVGKDTEFAYIEQETATTIEAGKPYIMYATASTVTAVLGDETNAPGANGAIHGTFSNLTQDQLNTYATVAGNDLYLVIGNELRRVTGYALDGITPLTGNSLPAQRAFVVVGDIPAAPAHMPAHVRAMPMQKDQAQGFENLDASEKPLKVVIDGTLYILRGEKVYDATGRLVK